MNCRKAERLMVRTRDFVLTATEKDSLDSHLRRCPRCRRARQEYQDLFGALLPLEPSQARSYSWERLKARIEEREAASRKPLYEKWALKAIPAAVALALLIGSASLLFQSPQPAPYSATEELLFPNDNAQSEAQTILEQQKLEDQGMMLIFASKEFGVSERR